MVSVVQLTDPDELKRRKQDADAIRTYADKVENGEITNMVIACNNREENCFEAWGTFRDRWHILGALE